MKHCLLCRQTVGPAHCPVEVEHCPNRFEHKHIGVDIGSKDATAVAIISPTGELVGLASTEQEAITFERLDKELAHLKPSSYFRRTNSKECSPWTPYDSTWIE